MAKKTINYTLNPMSMSTDTKWIGNITSVNGNLPRYHYQKGSIV